MRKKPKPDPTYFDGFIETQEVLIDASGTGTSENPKTICAAVELAGRLATQHGKALRFEIIVYERSPAAVQTGTDFGTVSGVKPNVRIYLYVDTAAMDRLVTLASAKRLSLIHVTSDKPHYGHAEIIRWSIRTAPEIGEQ
jgi:hypothetical protein